MIETLEGFPDRVVACRVSGVIHTDQYEGVVIPAVEAAFKRHDKIRVYCEVDGEVTADAGAMWDDFKLGVSHFTRWERMAIVTGMHWMPGTVKILSLMMPGEMRVFPPDQAAQARAWVTENL